jgi:hypothetical protein
MGVPYLVSLLTIAAAAAVLLVLLIRLAGRVRRLAGIARLTRTSFADHTGLLTARIAALRVELDRRRHGGGTESLGSPPDA